MSAKLANEAGTVQYPLVDHAVKVGWVQISEEDALSKRQGEEGLFFYDELEAALLRLNPGIVTPENVRDIISRMEALPATIEGNRQMLEWLRGQESVFVPAENRRRQVQLIDFDRGLEAGRNVFQVTNEWAFKKKWRKGNRPDIVFLINGIPVAVVECKNSKLRDGMEKAITQLRRYEKETPEMLTAPQVFNITHLIEYFYGVTWNYERKGIFNWRMTGKAPKPVYASGASVSSILSETPQAQELAAEDPAFRTYGEAVRSFFDLERFLDLLKEWILFFIKDDELRKTVLRQHQTRAVDRVLERCADAEKQRGLVWHTQGSGKTFTMITAARLVLQDTENFPGATVMLVVDRNELEGQLSGWVERLLGDIQKSGIKVEHAYRKDRLQELFDQDFRGLIISMIHKFDGIKKDSCTRPDFYVLIDEAHRSTGGDLGNYLMGALPHATLIGFTGTPIDKTAKGEGTFKVFGKDDESGYLDKYSIAESIEDRTTLRLRHRLAPSEIVLDEGLLEKEFLELAETEGVSDIEDLNRALDRAVNLKSFLKADDRIEKVAAFVARHYTENVQPLGYKCFLVAVDREACAKYKVALSKLLPEGMVATIYSKGANDVIDRPLVAENQLSEDEEKRVRKEFPKSDSGPKILIVTDKLLTGYDAPILYCMYLDKPMRDHVLLQAVARVNRPYEDSDGIQKPCGLIIDFIGILKDLKKALAFDSKDYSGVIEDLDILFARFCELMNGPAQEYLEPVRGKDRDAQLEKLLYGKFFEKDERDRYTELFKEIESLYEILSPDPELRDYIEPYNSLADLYVMMRNAYRKPTGFIGDLAHKTAELVQRNAVAHGLNELTKEVEFDEAALNALRKRKGSDEEKVVNLIKILRKQGSDDDAKEPHLIPISQRAEAVMESLEDRQISTQDALDQLEKLMEQRLKAEEERKSTGLDEPTFAMHWALREEGIEDSANIAKALQSAYIQFPDARVNADQMRQLKAEIYKELLKVVSGKRMIEVADKVMQARPW